MLDERASNQLGEIAARVLIVYARWRVTDPETYPDAARQMRDVSTMAADLADSLDDAMRVHNERGN